MTTSLRDTIVARLQADPKADSPWDLYVLASLDGPNALSEVLLEGGTRTRLAREAEKDAPAREPLGAYLKAISVEGFRGIGLKRTLELPPGPGLTLVVGRNGSGKSSFAEALELLLTRDTYRWKSRAKVWREGWRNLHHQTAAIEGEFLVEGEAGATLVATRWPDDADLAGAQRFAQFRGKKQMDPVELGWDPHLSTYRPFLSYNELGSMLDEGPSKLFDALASILGLEELTRAQGTLAEARLAREKDHKQAGETRDGLLRTLKAIEDERATALVTALDQKDWGLAEAEAVLTQATTGHGADADVHVLQQLSHLQAVEAHVVTAVARELTDAHARQKAAAGTLAGRSKDLAEILDHALRFHQKHGDGPCPVCGRKGALDAKWHEGQAKEVQELRKAAREATDAQYAADNARRRALGLPTPQPEVLAKAAKVGLDATATTKALEAWRQGLTPDADLEALARHIEKASGPLEAATHALREKATAELHRREDKWRDVAPALAQWLDAARKARKGAEAVKPLKAAEAWLKQTASDIRNERFAPIKERAQQVWNQLRLQSNVALQDIQLSGSAARRQVDLKVTVDDVEGAALGVMSQGEQNALALSLFIPRATLPESPFRFVVIDDPVQSMDPSRIDGLARVLQETAKKRQVVVFTHDDRLPEATRRLGINATILEVTRREGSVVEVRKGRDPVDRHLADALAVANTEGVPVAAARRVIPGLCRMAIEAACTQAVRRRRLARGERHADVEDVLAGCKGTTSYVSLALFDDPQKGGEVMPRLHKESRDLADVLRQCNEGAHGMEVGVRTGFIREAEKLARWLQAQK
jgi:DNA repair exonuclease SbcCD ATPase subunit